MVKLITKYNYDDIPRVPDPNTGERFYATPDGKKLPSVTTILSATKDKTFLEDWKKRVGETEAANITAQSSTAGTLMHELLEMYIKGEKWPEKGTHPVRLTAFIMAESIINDGLDKYLDEAWGLEAKLYYPGVYAGTTDLVGLWDGEPSIIDFKNTRKPKKEEWIEDYFVQLIAYGKAHNAMFGTDIKKGVILMASREDEYLGTFQKFVLEGDDWNKYCGIFANRINQFFGK